MLADSRRQERAPKVCVHTPASPFTLLLSSTMPRAEVSGGVSENTIRPGGASMDTLRLELEDRTPARSSVNTCIGTPDGISRIATAHALTALVNQAYGYRRVSDWDMQHRLRAGRPRRCHPHPLETTRRRHRRRLSPCRSQPRALRGH